MKAIKARRVDELMGATERMRKSDDIRELVRRLDERQTTKGKKAEGLDKWLRWALQQAEQLDPSVMSFKHLGVWARKRQLAL